MGDGSSGCAQGADDEDPDEQDEVERGVSLDDAESWSVLQEE
jgi:hypothetical protein